MSCRKISSKVVASLTAALPCRRDSMRRASITPAMSNPCGQRVEHVRHEAHVQMVLLSSTDSSPNCTMRITWFGSRSKCSAIGQPEVHLTHW